MSTTKQEVDHVHEAHKKKQSAALPGSAGEKLTMQAIIYLCGQDKIALRL